MNLDGDEKRELELRYSEIYSAIGSYYHMVLHPDY